jgi:hypothetical protein
MVATAYVLLAGLNRRASKVIGIDRVPKNMRVARKRIDKADWRKLIVQTITDTISRTFAVVVGKIVDCPDSVLCCQLRNTQGGTGNPGTNATANQGTQ